MAVVLVLPLFYHQISKSTQGSVFSTDNHLPHFYGNSTRGTVESTNKRTPKKIHPLVPKIIGF
jgi:hypothetical protein